jgi:hypothetical protein
VSDAKAGLIGRFFDATPSGRITNRLSKDMFSIDTEAGESELGRSGADASLYVSDQHHLVRDGRARRYHLDDAW